MKIVLMSIYGFNAVNVKHLASYLTSNGHKAYCIFFKNTTYTTNISIGPTEKEYELLLKKIEQLNPDIIGISLFCSSFKAIIKELIARLRTTKIPIIIGGVAATSTPEDYIDYVDYLCRGEGEYTLLELLNCLESGREPQNIKGLWYKKKNKIIKNNETRLTNIQELPFPIVDEATYIENNEYQSVVNYVYPLFTSRGCPYSCSYCINGHLRKYYSKCGKWLRRKTVENVIKELLAYKKKMPELGYLYINDDNFLYDYDWLKRFCKEYKEKINLPFLCFGTFADCDEKRIALIKDAGCKLLGLGIQSGSERIRREVFNRHFYTNEDIVKASKMLSKFKLLARYDIIVDNPFETAQDKEETLKVLLSLKRPFTLEIFSLSFYPNTPITEMALKKKLIREEDVEGSVEHKVVHDWRIDTNLMVNKEDLYYGSMFQLIDTRIPRIVIKLMIKTGFFKKHPELLRFSRYARSADHLLRNLKIFKKVNLKRSIKINENKVPIS